MHRPTVTVLVALTLAGPALAASFAGQAEAKVFGHHPDTGVPADEVIVAVLDTGIRRDHTEFGGWRGDGVSADPQIVAWWDFGIDPLPGPGETWDPHRLPYDSGHSGGHGTGTASLVGGLSVGAHPGVKLAIAKITDGGGALVNVDAAIEWAVKTVGADVVSMSFGTTVPWVGAIDSLDEAVQDATEAGALLVASAGNGAANVGVKFPDWTHSPGYSAQVLSVGASGKAGGVFDRMVSNSFSNTDPDVIAWGVSVTQASHNGGLEQASGTSFSTPLVAGWAAQLIEAARAANTPSNPQTIQRLIEWTAHDLVTVPYAFEGYGFVSDGRGSTFNTIADALAHAAAGTTPAAPAPDTLAQAVAADTARLAVTDLAELSHVVVARPTATPGELVPSAPNVRDTDLYTVPLRAGDTIEVAVDWTAGSLADDIDLYLFNPRVSNLGVYSVNQLRASSATGSTTGPNDESFTYRASLPGTYRLLVEGWAVGQPALAYTLEVKVNGAPVVPAFVGDHSVLAAV